MCYKSYLSTTSKFITQGLTIWKSASQLKIGQKNMHRHEIYNSFQATSLILRFTDKTHKNVSVKRQLRILA